MIDFLGYIFLIAGLLMLAGRIINNNITLLAIQSLALSILAFYLGFTGGEIGWHMVVVGLLTLIIKVIILPWLFYRLVDKIAVLREVSRSVGMVPSILIGVLLVGLTGFYIVPVLLKGILVENQLLSVSLSTILLGCYYMISRRSALSQLLGVIVMENGLFLCAVAVTGGMPLIIELGIFFDLMVGALVMGLMTYQIRDTFNTLDTKYLNKLQG